VIASNSLNWLVPALIGVPFVGALVLAVMPARRIELFRPVALLFSATTGILAIYLLTQFNGDEAGFQFAVEQPWVEEIGISLTFGVDGISLFLIVLTGLIFPIAMLGATPHHDPKPYYAWLCVLMGASMGVFMALDLVLFFVFFELVLVPMYFLIGLWGYAERTMAATKFFLYTMFGSALMLVGLVATAVLHQRGVGGELTFNLLEIANDPGISNVAARVIFVAFAVAFAIKVPLVPLHTWLPDAHTQAPTAGSVILAAVMLKLGTYGFLRFGIYLFPEAAVWAKPVLLTMAVLGITYGAIAATMQTDLKRLVAYSSIAHLGFVVLGLFSLTVVGIEGGILIMVIHGITTGALFLLVGMIYERRHTREISQLSGLQKSAPLLAAVMTIVVLASVGLPGLNGFPGELLALLGAFQTSRVWGIIAVTGVILAALYLLWAYQRTFHGPATGENAKIPDMRPSEFLVMAPLLVLIVVLGLFPGLMLDRMEPSVKALIDHVDESVDGFEQSVYEFVGPAPASTSDAEGGGHSGSSGGEG